MALTQENVAAYVKERLSELENGTIFAEGDELKALAIQGGNVNFSFCVKCEATGKTVFVKQAPEYVAIFGPDGLPLTSQRMQQEIDVYNEWNTLLEEELSAKYLPKIYHFNDKNMTVMMEFLDGFELLDHMLVDETGAKAILPESVTIGLGEFMGKTHAATLNTKLASEGKSDRIEYLTKHFENRAMRDIQLQFVFTKCYTEATDEQRAGLTMNDEFLKQVELLKGQYDGKSDLLALTHGDLHPGSVMVNHSDGRVKIIDPEFTIYGPPGLDVGSLLSGYVLAAIHQAFSKNPTATQTVIDGAKAIWGAYVKGMALDDEKIMKEIEIQSVGFCVAEVCRTALEFAGGRKWLQFDDAEIKEKSKKAALSVVDQCMIERHNGGIELLWEALAKATKDV